MEINTAKMEVGDKDCRTGEDLPTVSNTYQESQLPNLPQDKLF